MSPSWKQHLLKGHCSNIKSNWNRSSALQHHFKEAHSKGILSLSHILILPQTITETGRAVPLVLKCNPLARHETSQELSTNHFGWVFDTGISLHKLTGAERAGITPQLPLKQVTLKMKEASIQVMPSHSWHVAHIQESHHQCHVDIKLTLLGTYATRLAKAQHASGEHLLSSPQLLSLHTGQPPLRSSRPKVITLNSSWSRAGH